MSRILLVSFIPGGWQPWGRATQKRFQLNESLECSLSIGRACDLLRLALVRVVKDHRLCVQASATAG